MLVTTFGRHVLSISWDIYIPNCSIRPLRGSGFCCNPLPPTHCNRGECGFSGCNPWWFRFHLFTVCGCSILLTSVLSQWYSTYGWMNIQDVISGRVEVWLKHQATGLATLATCHSPPFEKGAHVRFLSSCWCIHLCIYKASPLPAYLCSSKKRTVFVVFPLLCLRTGLIRLLTGGS